ncbi:hypothetical protein GCM10027511_22410 [Hymenobacter humi]
MPLRTASHHSAPLPLGAAPLFSAPRHQPPALGEDGQSPLKNKFKEYPIGYLHVDFAEVQTEEGWQYLFAAIDRTSKVAFAELQPRATRMAAGDFLRRVLVKLPYAAHPVLTDNGVQFTP